MRDRVIVRTPCSIQPQGVTTAILGDASGQEEGRAQTLTELRSELARDTASQGTTQGTQPFSDLFKGNQVQRWWLRQAERQSFLKGTVKYAITRTIRNIGNQ